MSPDKIQPAPDPATPTNSTAATSSDSQITPIGLVIGIVLLLALFYAAPFFQNIIGILIVGFALYEAWKLNRRTELSVSGPHQVSTSSAPA
jgi:hypothetical protein